MIGRDDHGRIVDCLLTSLFVKLTGPYFTSILRRGGDASSILPCPGLFATPAILVWSPLEMLVDMVPSYDR